MKHTIHKYERVQVGSRIGRVPHEIFKCMLTNCPHFLPDMKLALGRLSQCWGECGDAVEIDATNVHLKRPMCDNCRKIRSERKKELSAIK